MTQIDFHGFDVLSFDCYGTLIDWETGILNALQPVLAPRGIEVADALLEGYAKHESAIESSGYLPYRDVLAQAFTRLCRDLGFIPNAEEQAEFSDSVGYWPAFRDSAMALRNLKEQFKLGVITNCDNDLFARSNRRLGVVFDWIITAEQARSYKPSLNNFELAFKTIGVPRSRILHVAQSLYHDHVPAKRLEMTTVWVNRRADKNGLGATPPAVAAPDLTVPDMRTLADFAMRIGS
jgi:2-haloacid dehalogenase